MSEFDGLLSQARNVAASTTDKTASGTITQLCIAVEGLIAGQTELRREIFREAVRGIATAVRNRKIPDSVSLAQEIPGEYGSEDRFAKEIEATGASKPVDLAELRHLRQKLKASESGNDELDDLIRHIYYASILDREPSLDMILPPGSPTRSIDYAALVVQRVLPNGWWTMGCAGDLAVDGPVAKVGTWTGDNPKPESATTGPLTLLAAMTLTMIEAAKRNET